LVPSTEASTGRLGEMHFASPSCTLLVLILPLDVPRSQGGVKLKSRD
jgi:hypothetical protein